MSGTSIPDHVTSTPADPLPETSSEAVPIAQPGNLDALTELGLPAEFATVKDGLPPSLLARRWRLEDHVGISGESLIGVTHVLDIRDPAVNPSAGSNNWSGSVTYGAWTRVWGEWKVPTVSKPPDAAGTDRGWDSSSWVGLDGSGSNDVLQAGVRHNIDAVGNASYYAWYEWYAPKASGSPDYIHETRIDNLPISAGDTVTALLWYEGGRGHIIFGNSTTGQYFSTDLAPPPGAAASGNSAEWVLEAPDSGEPGTSLPHFTPVEFLGNTSDGHGASGSPQSGTLYDIYDSGRRLTFTTSGLTDIFIEYLGNFFAEDWTARSGAHRAAGDPATMVTADQQHVFYRGTDASIRHIWWNAPTNGFASEDWTARSGAPLAGGDPATMVTADQQHVFYRGTDASIRHIWWNAPTNGFASEDWTARSGAPLAGGDPATMVTADQQHVFYRGTDASIRHIWWNAPTNGFASEDWTARSGAPLAGGDPATMVTADQQHVFYRGTDASIRHIWWNE